MVTMLYAGLFGLMLVVLSIQVIIGRIKGASEKGPTIPSKAFTGLMRSHGNFTEYVPMALILMYLFETSLPGVSPLVFHGLGLLLLIGRISHAYALQVHAFKKLRYRQFGMVATLLVITISAIGCIWAYSAMQFAAASYGS